MSMTGAAASVRMPAIAAARGAVLTLHSAAGLATTVDREAARMLRASEGLARAAVARLELAERRPVAPPAGAAAAAAGAGAAAGEMKNSKASVKKGRDNKGKGKGKNSVLMEVDPAVPGARAAPLRAEAAAYIPAADLGLGDEWADGVGPLGPAAARPAAARGGRPPRVLRSRRSGSRSPRRDDAETQPPVTLASPLLCGDIAVIKQLVGRPELNDKKVLLIEFEPTAGRRICALRNGERLRVLPEKLQSMSPAFQVVAKQSYENGL